MLFCSREFILFFLVVFALYWAVPGQRFRVYLLLVASFLFYAAWNQWLALLIVASTTLDYYLARGMDASTQPRVRRLLLTVSITYNLAILCYFKYANFFLRSLEDALASAGASASFPVLSVLLPLGISFYTFEAISYAVDVYRRRIPAERSLAHFMLFILFFPHLIAGPIVRGGDFLPQVRRKKRWNWKRCHVGLRLFLLGTFEKLVIADRMAMLADPVFADPGAYRGYVLWLAVLAYAVQVYGDFSGYTHMALGTAHLLGYRLAPNFDLPFLAANIADFWRRWHISLSSWLRDYVFIPLGGSRGSGWRTSFNLLLVMGLAGLWHGAAWSFVVFGLVHGAWLSLHRVFRGWAANRPLLDEALRSPLGTAVRVATTFTGFAVSLVIFRTASLTAAGTMYARMFTAAPAGLSEPFNLVCIGCLLGAVAMGHWVAVTGRWRDALASVPAPVLGAGYAAAMSLALVLTPDSGKAFIYFQF